jgi:GntR family transcriptional regulator/MocR family aminotransferase
MATGWTWARAAATKGPSLLYWANRGRAGRNQNSSPALLDPLLALRLGVDLHPPSFDQAILCDFMAEGHLGRHIRRMRDVYATRLAALQHEARRYLAGLLDVSPIQAGLNTAGFLRNGMSSRQAEAVATNHGIEAPGLDGFTLGRGRVEGLPLGFAAFDERAIRR